MISLGSGKAIGSAAVCSVLAVLLTTSCGSAKHSAGPSGPTLAGEIDQALGKLRIANVAFTAPRTMEVHRTAVIQLLISFKEPVSSLQDQLTEIGLRQGVHVHASDRMIASLTGLGFRITSGSPDEQVVGSGATEWRWEIEPTAAGRQRLLLTLSAVITVAQSPFARNIGRYTVRTFEKEIEVENVPSSGGTKARSFMAKNWQWFFSTLLLPIGAWLIRHFFKPAAAAEQPAPPKATVSRRRRRRG